MQLVRPARATAGNRQVTRNRCRDTQSQAGGSQGESGLHGRARVATRRHAADCVREQFVRYFTDQISARDAADRAARLDSADAAKALLDRAILHTDEPLAKAVASRAHERGWNDVVGKYGQTFDRQVFIDRMDEIPSGPRTSAADNVIFRVRPPRELDGHRSDNDLQRLVDQQVS